MPGIVLTRRSRRIAALWSGAQRLAAWAFMLAWVLFAGAGAVWALNRLGCRDGVCGVAPSILLTASVIILGASLGLLALSRLALDRFTRTMSNNPLAEFFAIKR